MVRRYYKYLLGLVLLLLPKPAYAADYECDYVEQARLKNIAGNYTYSLNESEVDEVILVDVTITNLHPDIYLYDEDKDVEYHYDTNSDNPSELTIKGLEPGTPKRIYAYPESGNCYIPYKTEDTSLLLTKYIQIPFYNEFHSDERCDKYQNQTVCLKWLSASLSEEVFENAMKELESNVGTETETVSEQVKSIFEEIKDFFLKYYMFVLPVIIIGALAGIIIYRRRNTYDF